MDFVLWLIILFSFLPVYYILRYYQKKYSYWRNLGVATPKYHYFVGNILDQLLYRRNIGTIITDAYNEFKGYNYIGFYNSIQPSVIIRNPHIIQDILVKEFSSFHDNQVDVDEDDPLFGKNPFMLNGDQWKRARGHIAPCFTSHKTKQIVPMLYEVSRKLLDYLRTFAPIGIDAKDLSMRIMTENIANCVLGIDGASFQSEPKMATKPIKPKPNKQTFYNVTQRLLIPSPTEGIENVLFYLLPFLQLFKPKDNKVEETTSFLTDIIQDSLTNRRENNIKRNDFLDLLQERRDKLNDEATFNMADILSHVTLFIGDGIDTSSIVLHHCLYELGRNPVVQYKLREELVEVKRELARNQELTYEMIEGMTYLDAFFKEVLRLHPPFLIGIKRVTRPYTLGPMQENNTGPSVVLPIGMPILLPYYGLNTDSNHHDASADFIPERFMHGNEENISKFTFLPFGEGPRKCLGMKLGTLLNKFTIITLLEHYEILVNSKTKEPVESDPHSFVNLPKDGYWIDLIAVE